MMYLDLKTPKELCLQISMSAKARRKQQKLTRKKLSELSGVGYGSIRRFEESGEISLSSLLKIAFVLDCSDEFELLFAEEKPQSIKEIIDGQL